MGWIRLHRRTHHPEIPFGIWKMCINGFQVMVGPFALSIHWPIWLHGEHPRQKILL